MKDVGLVLMAALSVLVYLIYMTLGPGGDGIIFGSVMALIAALAGIKWERTQKQGPLY